MCCLFILSIHGVLQIELPQKKLSDYSIHKNFIWTDNKLKKWLNLQNTSIKHAFDLSFKNRMHKWKPPRHNRPNLLYNRYVKIVK